MSFGSGNSNGFALQNSNVSRIFHIVNIDEIPYFMGSRPMTGLISNQWLVTGQDLDKIGTKENSF
jgi:hypothetical protein